MLELNKGHHRILYILAKHGQPIQKKVISQATARWNARNRNNVIAELVAAELVTKQVTPPKRGQVAEYFWLTPGGIETVDNLEAGGVIAGLPADWRVAI